VSKHTPGPWWTNGKYNGQEMGCAIIAANVDCGPLPGNPTRGMVAWSSAILNTKARECEANARLIAAAPDLLSGCVGVVEVIDWMINRYWGGELDLPTEERERIESARAAIAAATGEK
jgi:hypothetical protein